MVIVRKDFLPAALLEEVVGAYEGATDWAREDQVDVYGRPRTDVDPGRESFGGGRMPVDGEAYVASFDRSLALEAARPVQDAVTAIGGNVHRAYRMGPGQGFRVHTDGYFDGRFAHVLYLSRCWAWDWGGLLHVLDDAGVACQVVAPELNLLATMDHSTSRAPHFVSAVAPWARATRFTLSVFGG